MAQHNELGRWGEDYAVRFLQGKGYNIVDRDWHDGHKDLDIVAVYDGWLVIVEVKTRRNDAFLSPELAVDRRKIKNITLAANRYVKSKKIDLPVRFDIIAITGTEENHCRVEHIEDAFMPFYFR